MRVKLNEGAFMPTRAHIDDAGFDLYCPRYVYIQPHGKLVIDTGVHVEIPKGYYGDIKAKSGLFFKKDLITTGTVDSGYRGSIHVKLVNLGDKGYTFDVGDKIAQMVITPCYTPELELSEELTETDRGSNGFGSTGR